MTGDIVVSQLGARGHYAIPCILAANDRLAHLYTDICATRGWPALLRRLPRAALAPAWRRLADRVPHDVPDERITTFPTFGLVSAGFRLRNRDDIDVMRHAVWAGKRFSELVARKGFADASGLYAVCGEAVEQMAEAKRLGLWTALEQINAPRDLLDRLVGAEHARFPGWQRAPAANPYAATFAARERAEWELADVILCPSEFVRRGIAECGGPIEKCALVPYGVDTTLALPERLREPGPLRVLTVGQVGLRKGSPYVHAAAERMKNTAEFRLVGTFDVERAALHEIARSVEITGPIPRGEIRAHYAWADVFLLPSVCEGSAAVVYEALAAGLPVVVTENTGSVARDGEDGFIVPLGDVDAIVAAIERLASDEPLRRAMGASARRRSLEYRLDHYGERLLAVLPARRALTLAAAVPRRFAAA